MWPGLCLTVVVYCLNMVGDAVRDLLDPRLRGGSGRLGAYGAQAVGKAGATPPPARRQPTPTVAPATSGVKRAGPCPVDAGLMSSPALMGEEIVECLFIRAGERRRQQYLLGCRGERRRVGGEPLRNLDAPRQQYLADYLRAAFRAAFRTAALVPLAPLRTEQRIVIRSGTFARTQGRC